MKYQETGRFGRLTKNLRKQGFEAEMEKILHDSKDFQKLNKKQQTKYIETVMDRMVDAIGQSKTNNVLFACGEQCCGKSWSTFVKKIWTNSESLENFFENLNEEEEKYNTSISYDHLKHSIKVNRTKCICGLINKGEHFVDNNSYCNCSTGHMSKFFNSVFSVKKISLIKTIYNGADKCEWNIVLNE
ncbi:DUF6144 family protein [Labilibaculum sp. DW002]|uniref:DUF6144 family protein n=1 Tax=Paralabilibaculum antarcticum TaxID=2912572 RepID=A0ABT5VWF4_9BACT|nr:MULTISPECIES: DUF6144 family protein [unclassified Labilibaculum]MBI9058996.1 hypothetical protein [Labilibaculum sp.]MDE5419748.1 DUF6144 family protein [Labilibaculum sp. DW002]